MLILDSLLIGGLRFVLDKIVAAAEAESSDDASLREQLLEAQMRVELGEMSSEEFTEVERDLLTRIRHLRAAHKGPLTMSPNDRITGVEVESYK